MTTQPLLIDLSRFRRMASATCLLLAGPLVIAGILATPYPDDAAAAARDPLRTQLAADLLFLGYLLMVPGILAMLRLVGRRGAALAHMATVIALAGWITLPGLVLSDFYELNAAQQLGPAQADILFNHFGDYPGFLIIAAPGKYLAGLGLVLLAAALWRAKAAHWWQVATLAGWFVAVIVMRGGAVEAVDLVASAALSFGLISIAISVFGDPRDSEQPAVQGLQPSR